MWATVSESMCARILCVESALSRCSEENDLKLSYVISSGLTVPCWLILKNEH